MMNPRIAVVAAALVFVFSSSVAAELQHVEIKTLGMD